MLCPKCGHTIREEQRYLMSRDPDAEWPSWGKYGIYLLAVVILAGLLSIAHAHGLAV